MRILPCPHVYTLTPQHYENGFPHTCWGQGLEALNSKYLSF